MLGKRRLDPAWVMVNLVACAELAADSKPAPCQLVSCSRLGGSDPAEMLHVDSKDLLVGVS